VSKQRVGISSTSGEAGVCDRRARRNTSATRVPAVGEDGGDEPLALRTITPTRFELVGSTHDSDSEESVDSGDLEGSDRVGGAAEWARSSMLGSSRSVPIVGEERNRNTWSTTETSVGVAGGRGSEIDDEGAVGRGRRRSGS